MNKINLVSLEAVHTHTHTLALTNEIKIKIKYKKDSNKPVVENYFLQ